MERGVGEEKVRVLRTLVGEKARRKTHGDGVPAKWCERKAEEFGSKCQEKSMYLGRMKWKVAELDVAEEVVALGVAEEEEEVAEPKMRLPVVIREGSITTLQLGSYSDHTTGPYGMP